MEFCRYTKKSFINRLASFILLMIAALPFLFCIYGFSHLESGEDYYGLWLLLLLALLLSWKIAIPYFCMETRRYCITKDGIMIGGCFRKPKLYSWDQIRHIGIYAFEANAPVTDYCSVICCFWGSKADDFDKRIVKQYFYAAYRQGDFVLFDYSDGLFDELRLYYPMKIHDYRADQVKYYNLETYRKMQDK